MLPGTDITITLQETGILNRGHFRYESGHHGDIWLDLERLFVSAKRMETWVQHLAEQAISCRPEVTCGPLTGGAFVAQLLAVALQTDFAYTERHSTEHGVEYRLPDALKETVKGRRVLIVDDAINAGSALLTTRTELFRHGAEIAGYASLITSGETGMQIAKEQGIPLFTLLSLERNLWDPDNCPLCSARIPLQDFVPK